MDMCKHQGSNDLNHDLNQPKKITFFFIKSIFLKVYYISIRS